MEEILAAIKDLNEKSIDENQDIEGIKEFIKYKYPVEPSTNEQGTKIYDKVLSKVNSRWDDGQLDDMKVRSMSRQGSPKLR